MLLLTIVVVFVVNLCSCSDAVTLLGRKVELELEGGRAFGTGEHPTTSMYVRRLFFEYNSSVLFDATDCIIVYEELA